MSAARGQDPLGLPPDITEIADASDWMLARMREGHSVIDPLLSNVILPNGLVLLNHREWEDSEPEYEDDL